MYMVWILLDMIYVFIASIHQMFLMSRAGGNMDHVSN